MPLPFPSLSHGRIAFGFFNIETDMLLLENYFFFAADFCAQLGAAVREEGSEAIEQSWPVDQIASASDIGDLMGAIRGEVHSGFIGALYRRFPFPSEPEQFKQNPDGFQTRAEVEKLIADYSTRSNIDFRADPRSRVIAIGGYRFERSAFQELVRYVWYGGYPRWLERIRPQYVLELEETVRAGQSWLFDGIRFVD